jgi:hypothetical protein
VDDEALVKLAGDLPGVELFAISGVSRAGVEKLLEVLWSILKEMKEDAPAAG